jgi:exonuclease SbcC
MVLSKLFHVSDIHIRHGDFKQSRYTEYSNVFDNLHASLQCQIKSQNLNNTDFLIIVTGDIFHNKNIIGNYGLTLYKKFIQSLTSLGRTIIFHGNHDRNQNEIDQPSLVSSTLDIPNLTILTKSESFIIDNIGFSYCSIDDTLDATATSGRTTVLPSFPQITDTVKCKVALFHGTFANVKLYNGTDVTDTQNPYPFSMLQGFDFALLGDIHLRQQGLYDNSTLWGYSGSLVQQNYGEDIINHGYMIWDLNTRSITNINVYNPYGMVNLKTVNDTICIRKRGQYEPLDIIPTSFPKHIDIKLYSDIDLPTLLNLLSTHNITFNIVNKPLQNETPEARETPSLSIDHKVDKDTLLQHFSKHLTPDQNTILSKIINSYDNLLFDVSKYPDDLQDKCLKINKELSTLVADCQHTQSTSDIKYPFTIKYLEWTNLLCYEGTQWIDFEKAEHSTFMITGKNGTGKSAIYDVLTLAIWGEITKSKQNREIAYGIINYKFSNASTIIDIECNNQLYRIARIFAKQNKDDKFNLNNATTSLYKYVKPNEIELFKSDNAAKIEINKLFSTSEDFLTSSMITQNIDFDMLRMDHKDIISLIDKQFDIQYIYSLYELFKSAKKKYLDLKKIIESKIEVYDKVATTSPASGEVETMQTELTQLETSRQELCSTFNSILIDINDKKNQAIIQTDYDQLIKDLPPSSINTDEEYANVSATLSELRLTLKGIPEHKIQKLRSEYTQSITSITSTNTKPVSKPCEYTFIESEENVLSKFSTTEPQLLPEFANCSVNELHTLQSTLESNLLTTAQQLEEHNHAKPVTIKEPIYTESSIIDMIRDMYTTAEALNIFCNTNVRQVVKQDGNMHLTHQATLSEYQQLQTEHTALQELLTTIKAQITTIDTEFKTLHTKQSTKTIPNKPEQSIPHKTSKSVNKYLTSINIADIQSAITHDEAIMETFYENLDKLTELNTDLKTYQAELDTLTTNDEYKYNPSCEYCCKRPWVCRINQLTSLITSKKDAINKLNTSLYDESNKELVNKHQLYSNWLTYYSYKEENDLLTNSINKLLSSKEDLITKMQETETKLRETADIMAHFNAASFDLYDMYNNIQAYKTFTGWKETYDHLQTTHTSIQKKIKNISQYLSYTTDILPRKQKLEQMKQSYLQWQTYDKNLKINAAYQLHTLQEDATIYEKHKEFSLLKSLKPIIIQKIELNQHIHNIENQIKTITNKITEHKTMAACASVHHSKQSILTESLGIVQDTIDIMTIVVDKFVDYRKDLYSTYILPKLTAVANSCIKTLCHNTSKMFELDYLVTIFNKKDIHINWLIRNITENQQTQTISIKQASGFQQFAISFALRMSLFNNKCCQQLFIDEGFTACDKDNLSIVPMFLQALLKSFKSIIIVSHIDLIRDSIDNIAQITYNENDKSSAIHYGDQKIVSQKRRKLK